MKTMLGLRRHHYTARVSIFLLIVALVAGMVGCVQPLSVSYDLTIASTAGGSVTIPGQGTFTYDEGTVVNLVATPDPSYQFVSWTGNVSTIGDVDNATTTIVMNDAYFIIANFVKQQYGLTTTSTAGGLITMPGEGTFVWDGGTVVNLVAKAEEGYKFVTWTGNVSTIKDLNAAQTTITMNGSYSITANFESKYTPMVAGGSLHTVGLKVDGTVVAAGYNEYAECVVGDWSDIIQVLAGTYHTVGLKADGTVVTAGWCVYAQCNVAGWTDIIQVAGSFFHTVGLKSNGTVVAVGNNSYGQCDVGSWTHIVQVAGGGSHTVGLKADGTVVAVGDNKYGQCNVGAWTNIVQVAAGYYHTVGLRADGTVVAVGGNFDGQCAVGGWTDIVQVAAGYQHTVGLRSDGSVLATGLDYDGSCSGVVSWTNIVQVAGGYYHTVGLRRDGTVVAVGNDGWLQCNVGDWMLR
jgi:alpha-tubulin suppressor-like RCC1 family protein